MKLSWAMLPPKAQRFLDRKGDCWVSSKPIEGKPFPNVYTNGKPISLRRYVWSLTGRKMHIRRRFTNACGERFCCNPDHLYYKVKRGTKGGYALDVYTHRTDSPEEVERLTSMLWSIGFSVTKNPRLDFGSYRVVERGLGSGRKVKSKTFGFRYAVTWAVWKVNGARPVVGLYSFTESEWMKERSQRFASKTRRWHKIRETAPTFIDMLSDDELVESMLEELRRLDSERETERGEVSTLLAVPA